MRAFDTSLAASTLVGESEWKGQAIAVACRAIAERRQAGYAGCSAPAPPLRLTMLGDRAAAAPIRTGGDRLFGVPASTSQPDRRSCVSFRDHLTNEALCKAIEMNGCFQTADLTSADCLRARPHP